MQVEDNLTKDAVTPSPPLSNSTSPRLFSKNKRQKVQKQQSTASTSSVGRIFKIHNSNKDDTMKADEVPTGERRRKHSNLFPCPLVKTLDLDSPDGSLSSLGIVSGLNHYNVPFASSTSYTLACQQQMRRRRRGMPTRAKSVQSPSHHAVAFTPSTPSWLQRQQSLPTCTITPSPSPNPTATGSTGPSPAYSSMRVSPISRSPRSPMLKQAKSMHAQTHKVIVQTSIYHI